MPASSPYQNNDYQAANSFRPNRLPINDIMKAFVAQNTFWDQGAERVKNVYDNALNLSLTLDENKRIRDEYMKEAEKQIAKLSAQDLSDLSVQRQGIKIFKPLLSDKSIILDNHITNLRSSIFQDAESYKDKKLSKDGPEGEGYSDINLSDALDGFEDFNSKTPRDERLLNNVYERIKDKRYIPFYNINKTLDDALKNCKGAINQDTDADGLNDRITKTTGISAATAKLCIETAIANDNKALEQIAINGRQQYKNNRSALVRDIQPYLQHDIDQNDAMIRTYQADRLALINSKKGTPEQIAQYDEIIGKYEDAKKKAQQDYFRISANDWNDVDQNYKSWSQRIYKNQLLSSYAQPRATQGKEVSIDGNPGRIAEYNKNAEDARTLFKAERDDLRAEKEHEYRLQEKLFEMAHSKDSKMSLSDKLRYGKLPGQKDFDPRNITFLEKATESTPETLSTIREKLSQNYDASYGDLQDIAMQMKGIDNAEFVEALNTPPTTQAEYAKVIEIANRYLDSRAKQLGGTDKLTGQDASLLQSINNYREKVSYSNSLHSILDNAMNNAKKKNESLTNENIQLTNKIIENTYNTMFQVPGKYIQHTQVDGLFIMNAMDNPNYSIQVFPQAIEITNKNDGSYYTIANKNGLIDIYKKLERTKSNYVSKVNEELLGSQALNKFTYKGDESTDAIVTDNMQRLFPKSTDKYTFKSMTQDVRNGNVKFKIIKKGKKDDESLTVEDLKDIQEEFGKAVVSEGSLFQGVDKETGVAIMNIPSIKIVQRSYLDDSIDLMKEDLANRARNQRKPMSEVVFETRGEKIKIILQATPLSTGTKYTIKTQGPKDSTPKTVQEFENMTDMEVNAAIEKFRTLDSQPQIKQ